MTLTAEQQDEKRYEKINNNLSQYFRDAFGIINRPVVKGNLLCYDFETTKTVNARLDIFYYYFEYVSKDGYTYIEALEGENMALREHKKIGEIVYKKQKVKDILRTAGITVIIVEAIHWTIYFSIKSALN
jgi:hypothetical protein